MIGLCMYWDIVIGALNRLGINWEDAGALFIISHILSQLKKQHLELRNIIIIDICFGINQG